MPTPHAESGGFYDGWPKKRPLIVLVEQFRIIRFPFFPLLVLPAFAGPKAQSQQADFPFGAVTAPASECGNVYKCHRLTDDEELEREGGKKNGGVTEIRRCGERKGGGMEGRRKS